MMDNESTQYIPGNNGGQNFAQSAPNAPVYNQPQPKKDDTLARAGFAAGGFLAGAGSVAAVNVMASKLGHMKDETLKNDKAEDTTGKDTNTETTNNEPTPVNPETPTQNTQVNTSDIPTEQESIIATDEGIRVAQVNDNQSFSQAFAEARQQVGPGGVFEWHGKVYGTYYKSEWEHMSGSERAEWQAKVDYDDVRDYDSSQLYAHHDSGHHHSGHHTPLPSGGHDSDTLQVTPDEPLMASNEELVDDTPVDGEIKIIGVGPIEMEEGLTLDGALLEDNTGDQMLLVDIDSDGTYDVILHDDNFDGEITNNEVHDISDWDATVQDVEQAFLEQNDIHYAVNDNLPDYTNDADLSNFA